MQETGSPRDQAGGSWRDVRHYGYVERSFEDVSDLMRVAPDRVLGRAGEVELRVRRAGVDLSRTVRVTWGRPEVEKGMVLVPVRWEDARHPDLFPVLEAHLELAPISAGRLRITQAGLVGRYRPPLGRLGVVGDALAGRRVVLDSVEGFLDDLVRQLTEAVRPAAEGPSLPAEEVPPVGGRRVFLPVDNLEWWPGGAVGLRNRLAAEPGVTAAEVDPAAGMAVLDYDPGRCSVGVLVAILEADPYGEPRAPSEATT